MNVRTFFIVTSLLMISHNAMAEKEWQCVARDKTRLEWQSRSAWERLSLNTALELCKRNSTVPATCKVVANTDCELFIDGQTTRPMWRCIALDIMAKSWVSKLYPQRDDAAVAAKNYCMAKSGYPDTCYINLMTCRNMNERA